MDLITEYLLNNYNNVCRFCMQISSMSNNLEKVLENSLFYDRFEQVFGIQLSAADNLPPNICEQCLKVLPDYLTFHLKCLETHKQLQALRQITSERKSESELEFSFTITNDEIDAKVQVKDEIVEEESLKDKETLQHLPEICMNKKKIKLDKQTTETKHKKKPSRKPKQCPVCGTIVQRLEMHMRIHNDDLKLICDYCGKKFTGKSNLVGHMSTHVQMPRVFNCNICPKSFARAPELKMHLIMHSGSRNYKCDMCDMAFNRAYTLRSHKIAIHLKTAKYLCELCDKKYYTRYHLNQHYKGKHWREHGEVYKCNFCDLRLKNQRTLNIHLRIHTGVSEFVCKICSKVVATKNGLLGHMKCHDNPKGRAHLTAMKEMRLRLSSNNVNA